MGLTYIRWWGFSINEGGKIPVNIHIHWIKFGHWFFVYIRFFRLSINWYYKNNKWRYQNGEKTNISCY